MSITMSLLTKKVVNIDKACCIKRHAFFRIILYESQINRRKKLTPVAQSYLNYIRENKAQLLKEQFEWYLKYGELNLNKLRRFKLF